MIAPMMGLVFWISLFWRRMTVAGAWTTTLTGFAAWWLSTQVGFVAWLAALPHADAWRLTWSEAGGLSMYAPWQILFYMITASAAGIIVSLFTKPVAGEKLDRFYRLTRTPVQPQERITTPCQLPLDAPTDARPVLRTAWGLEAPLPSRASCVGFVIAWLLVGAMIGGFMWLI